jgi:hypothetical protein
MHAVVKIAIGAILLIASIWYVYTNQNGSWDALLTVINGVVPAFVALLGVFIVWLELDELQIKGESKPSRAAKKR